MIRPPALTGLSVNKLIAVLVRLTAKLRNSRVIGISLTSADAHAFRILPPKRSNGARLPPNFAVSHEGFTHRQTSTIGRYPGKLSRRKNGLGRPIFPLMHLWPW